MSIIDPNDKAKRLAEIAERVAALGVYAGQDIPFLLAQHAALQRMLAESDAVVAARVFEVGDCWADEMVEWKDAALARHRANMEGGS